MGPPRAVFAPICSFPEMAVKVIAGLGNPGASYRDTRHNVGFHVVDRLAERAGVSWSSDKKVKKVDSAKIEINEQPIHLLKPLDFMNHSGRVLSSWARYYRVTPEEVVVIYDDITLDPARSKISVQGGDGGHNGVADILQHFGKGFVRFRIGIGPKLHPEMNLADFVLGKLPEDHRQQLEHNMTHYLEGLISLVDKGPVLTMNQFNQKQSQDERN